MLNSDYLPFFNLKFYSQRFKIKLIYASILHQLDRIGISWLNSCSYLQIPIGKLNLINNYRVVVTIIQELEFIFRCILKIDIFILKIEMFLFIGD